MEKITLPFTDTGYFSNLIQDYLAAKEALHPFYRDLPSDAAFGQQIALRQQTFDQDWRKELASTLNRQYDGFRKTPALEANLKVLAAPNSFTVVTGHQLNLFTGPLYFLYKIAHTIKLCTHLKTVYPEHNFVPVYWMATEDHDFEEISFFRLKGKHIHWNREAKGAVGRLSTTGLEEVFQTLDKELGPGEHADTLRDLFRSAYLEHEDLASATRHLANRLFGEYGLVIVDGDDVALKKQFAPYVARDLREKISFTTTSQAAESLERAGDYHVQVNPREVNYFYLEDALRERLEEGNGGYHVVDTNLSFGKAELFDHLREHPEKFSPNVITRPLYQEVVLPNLGYVGGGGELAYWLELKPFFEAMDVPFPLLSLRNAALMVGRKDADKAKRLEVPLQDLFLDRHALVEKKVRAISDIAIDLSPLKEQLRSQFEYLYELAEKTDPSFVGAVKAQEVKQGNGVDKLEKRLLKAQKRKLDDHVRRLTELQERLFPNQGLQERQANFSEIYLELGSSLIPGLLEAFEPYPTDFTILKY